MSQKTKKIVKSTKTRRTRSKYVIQIQPTYLSLFKTSKNIKNPKNAPMMRTCINKTKVCENFPSSSQNITINLNLGKYGFDNQKRTCFKNTEQLLTLCGTLANITVNHQNEGKQLLLKTVQRFGPKFNVIQRKNTHAVYSGKIENFISVTKQQLNLLYSQNRIFFNRKSKSTLSSLIERTKQHSQLVKKRVNSSLKYLEQKAEVKKTVISNKNNLLMRQIALKTFAEGLCEPKVDELNYFLLKEYQQNNRSSRFQKRISNWQEWVSFIQKKRVRLRKAAKFLLHTSCQFCLSPYSEANNPIENCPQCHIRGHRLCLGEGKNSRCGRCTYLRLPNESKVKIPQCYICSTINLAPLKISSLKYAHIFCLFCHNMWQVREMGIQFEEKDSSLLENTRIRECGICHKNTHYYTKCLDCQSFYHYSCAFLNGFGFKLDRDNNVNLSCCSNSRKLMEETSQMRKYILNYNNIVFKRLATRQKEIRKGRKRGRKPKINNEKINEQDQNILQEENLESREVQQKNQSKKQKVEKQQLEDSDQFMGN